jgi:hypothetical protein
MTIIQASDDGQFIYSYIFQYVMKFFSSGICFNSILITFNIKTYQFLETL